MDAAFEKLLWNPPTPENWRLLCEAIHALPEDASLDKILVRVEGALQNWPYELRATMCSLPWDEQLSQGVPNRKASIVRYLRYDRIFVGRYGEIMFRSPDVTLQHLEKMSASSVTSNLQKINLSFQKLSPEAGAILAKARAFDRLESLDLYDIGLKHGLASLAAAPWLSHLREIKLGGNQCGDEATSTFLRSPHLSSIEVLRLSKNDLTAKIATSFTEGALPNLRELDLSENNLQGGGLSALARSFPLHKLLSLQLQNNNISNIEALESLPRELNISSNALAQTSLEALCKSAKQKTSLILQKCQMRDDQLLDLRGLYEQIEALDLSDNALNAAGLLILGEHFPGLKKLSLGNCGLSPELLGALIDRLPAGITALILPQNHLNKEVLSLLSKKELPLEELSLEKTKLTGPCFAALAKAPWMKTLRILSLRENRLSKAGLAMFSAEMPHLESLWLDNIKMADDGAERLALSSWRPKTLNLSNNPIGDRGVAMLANSPVMRDVTNLYINKINVSDEGALALANSPYLKELEVLHIEGNQLGDTGAKALASCRHWKKIHWDNNPNIGKSGQSALRSWPKRCCP